MELLRNAEGEQQSFVDDVHGAIGVERRGDRRPVEVIDVRDALRAPALDDHRSDVLDRLEHRRHIAKRRLRNRPTVDVLQRIAVEVGHQHDLAGAQELAGVEVAVNPVTSNTSGLAQRPQGFGDVAIVEPLETVESGLGQLQIGHCLIGHRFHGDRARLQVGECRVQPRRDCSYALCPTDQRVEGQLVIEPGDHVVDEPVPAIDSTRQELGDDGVDEAVALVEPDERRHLGKTGRGEMADQLDAGMRHGHWRTQPLDDDPLVDHDTAVGLIDRDRPLVHTRLPEQPGCQLGRGARRHARTVAMATFLFMPESAYGPTNNCIGIGNVLRQRGHTVVFAAEASWAGRLEPLGFVEDLVDLSPPPPADAPPQAAGQFWTDFIRDTKPVFRTSTLEQLSGFVQPTWQALIDGAMYCEPQLKEIIGRQQPDVIVEDNVNCFPALTTAGVPYVRIVSCQPLEMRGPDIPPTFSGLPTEDRSEWDEFRAEFDRTHRPTWQAYDEWVRSTGAKPLGDLEFIHESDVLNLYTYPEVIDYTDRRPLAATWHRLDSSVRATDAPFDVPAELDGDGALIYLSLGSLGSADVELMQRLVDVLSRTPHRYIVSKGPLHDTYELPPNMWGAQQVPQTTVLPHVDLVITHGGNNTTTESFHFGKPMVLLPLFWDQYDNAQRVDETGYGVRLATYAFEDDELIGAVDRLLDDGALHTRMAANAAVIRSRDGTTRAADLIEAVAR